MPTKKGGKAGTEVDSSVVMPDGKTMSKKARKKAEEGMGQSLFPFLILQSFGIFLFHSSTARGEIQRLRAP